MSFCSVNALCKTPKPQMSPSHLHYSASCIHNQITVLISALCRGAEEMYQSLCNAEINDGNKNYFLWGFFYLKK